MLCHILDFLKENRIYNNRYTLLNALKMKKILKLFGINKLTNINVNLLDGKKMLKFDNNNTKNNILIIF